MADILDTYSTPRPDVYPIIYAYSDSHYPGYYKVGHTNRTIEERMAEHYPTLLPGPKPYKVHLIETAMRNDGTDFLDHKVHEVLEHKGFPKVIDPNDKKTEWFKCTIDDIKSAIIAVKNRSLNIENRTNAFSMRPEQERAVKQTKAYFEKEIKENPHVSPKFLWNAKMRFGKTFASYELAKLMELKRVLVLTFKPAVESAWEDDLKTHVDFEGWQFYSKKTEAYDDITPNLLDVSRPIVCFGSFQDYLGTNEDGGIKTKNEWVHTTNWDLVIFDEYHFGAWRENAKKLFQLEDEDAFDSLDIEKYKIEEADNAYNESFLPITTKYYLFLSGTPFRALNSGEFIEEQIFNWTYQDEQLAKISWNDNDGNNPYASLPKMVMLTYTMPDEIRNIAVNTETNEFDLNIFFSADATLPDKSDAQFKLKAQVQKWLNLIRGSDWNAIIDDFKISDNEKPAMPFSDIRLLRNLTHTLWFLPNVASCYAMYNLLKEPQNVFYQDYKINICAGTSAGVGLDALKPVQQSMDDPLRSKSITLSCGKLTTGITVKPWTGILMLRSLSSPETYFQSAFRVQSPWTTKDNNDKEYIIKKECYVIDFDINRALKQVSDYGCGLSVKNGNPEKKVAEFINFLPILAYDGATMKEVNAIEVLDLMTAGTSATLLAKRWQSALLVNVDNDTLSRLLANDKAIEALMKIEGFRNLNKDIKTIINRSSVIKKAKQKGGLTNKEQQKLSKEEKELKTKRKQIQEKLIKFATRIPIFMFLSDYRERSLKDVVTQLEPTLFKKVTGLSVLDFELLVSLGLFNDALMNDAVYKFKRYEDASLEYTGINKHSIDNTVGLFSTTISKEDYEMMANQQRDSMFKKRKQKSSYSEHDENNSHIIANTSNQHKMIKLEIGDKVEHITFGIGVIVVISNNKFTVEFDASRKTFINPQAFVNGFMKKV